MVEGDGGVTEGVRGCEGLEEAVGGRGGGPGDVEVVEGHGVCVCVCVCLSWAFPQLGGDDDG